MMFKAIKIITVDSAFFCILTLVFHVPSYARLPQMAPYCRALAFVNTWSFEVLAKRIPNCSPRKIKLQIPVLHFTLYTKFKAKQLLFVIGKAGMNKNLTTLLSTSNILQSSLKSVTFQKTKDLLNTESYFPFNALYGKVYYSKQLTMKSPPVY